MPSVLAEVLVAQDVMAVLISVAQRSHQVSDRWPVGGSDRAYVEPLFNAHGVERCLGRQFHRHLVGFGQA